MVKLAELQTISEIVMEHSRQAGLTIIGFREEMIEHESSHKFFTDFPAIGDIVFVNASLSKEIG